ncbi:Crp/Fnr family transcriptional regulator [Marivirga lumbricoides]|uniref:Crp/Fnr family transcriptional regulator n=1 Tax=Marivirga lumbricoides TaxID=1046115 RepID=A0A2T4DS01_9BACT|nr:Crp/Fnr family transcriptional regulator [Marivirga lumbricoides]
MSNNFLLYNYLQKSPRYKEKISERISSLFFKKGDYIYKPSEELYTAYELVKGVVKVGSYSKDGNECVYDILKPGDIFGNLHYLDGNFQEFTKCLTDVELRLYDLVFYKRIVIQDYNIAEWFNQYIVRRWCRAETRFFTTISEDILTRIKRLYKEFNYTIKDANGKEVNIFALFSQKDIADLTGSTRQSVAQTFRKIENKQESLKMEMDTVKMP